MASWDADDDDLDSNTDINALRKELLELREWRDQEGIPAIQRNEVLQNTIDIRNIQNEKIQIELDALKLEAQQYTQEIVKLKQDNSELLDEIATLHQTSSMSEMVNKALIQKDQCIEVLQNNLEKTQIAFQLQRKRNVELAQLNSLLTAESQQYAVILDKLQRDETSLKGRIASEEEELRTLQLQYASLRREKEESDFEATTATLHAQQLSTQIHEAQDALRVAVSSNGNDEGTLDLEDFGGFGNVYASKTIKYTLRSNASGSPDSPLCKLDAMEKTEENSMRFFALGVTEQSTTGDISGAIDNALSINQHSRVRARGSRRNSTGSVKSNTPGSHGTAGSLGITPRIYYHSFDAKDSVLSDCEEEGDEKQGAQERIIRDSLMAQHSREMREMEGALREATEQMNLYKTRWIETKQQLKDMKELRDGKEGGGDTTARITRRHHGVREQRIQELREEGIDKNCVLFGWKMW